jgi:hypothetical protein
MSEDGSKYKQYFEWARNELKQLTKWKIGIIKQLAEKLEAAGMPLEMISSEITRELNDYDVSERYIRSCLDHKYKDASKKRNKEIDVCGTHATDDGKKEIEVLSGGIEGVAVDGHTQLDAKVEPDGKKVLENLYGDTATADEPSTADNIIIEENKNLHKKVEELTVDIEELKRKLREKPQHNNNNDKAELANLKTLSQEQLIDKVLELTDALEKTQLFQSPTELPTAPGDNEVILPGKFLTTVYMILTNGEKDSIHLTIRGSEVIALEAHYQRIRKEDST